MSRSWGLLLLLVAPGVFGYKMFQDRIPNGAQVPHPCLPNYVWHGVGHMAKDGGGMRNAFGNDFDRNGQKWDRCLCEEDSDGDGKTNGEELGDPDCEWVPGATPKITDTTKLSHPGICDPHDSDECKRVNNWDVCENNQEFNCDAFNKEDVQNFTLKTPRFDVPADVTTYMCVTLDLPRDGDWHIIGFMPEIDNANVMHHVTMALCSADAVEAMDGQFDEPSSCGMAVDACEGTTVIWTVGLGGVCMPESYGMRIGEKTPYTKAKFQYHYNNPEKLSGYADESGVRIFIEPRQRPNDKVDGMISVPDIAIPPKQLSFESKAACTAECSQEKLNETRYITNLLPHMHYLGRGMIVEHYRGEQKLPDLLNSMSYSYDSPETVIFDPPVEYRPGDKIVVRCIFNTMNKDGWTYFGENTADEMCVAFMAFYPPPAFTCFGISDEQAMCANGIVDTSSMFPVEDSCPDLVHFIRNELGGVLVKLQGACDATGLICQEGCEEAIVDVRQHGCMQGVFYTWVKILMANQGMHPLLNMLHSCEQYTMDTLPDSGPSGSGSLCTAPDATDAAVTSGSSVCVLLTAVMAALMRL